MQLVQWIWGSKKMHKINPGLGSHCKTLQWMPNVYASEKIAYITLDWSNHQSELRRFQWRTLVSLVSLLATHSEDCYNLTDLGFGKENSPGGISNRQWPCHKMTSTNRTSTWITCCFFPSQTTLITRQSSTLRSRRLASVLGETSPLIHVGMPSTCKFPIRKSMKIIENHVNPLVKGWRSDLMVDRWCGEERFYHHHHHHPPALQQPPHVPLQNEQSQY